MTNNNEYIRRFPDNRLMTFKKVAESDWIKAKVRVLCRCLVGIYFQQGLL